jgi:hypothetical protein
MKPAFIALLLLLIPVWAQQTPTIIPDSNIQIKWTSKSLKSDAFVSCDNGGTMHILAVDSMNVLMAGDNAKTPEHTIPDTVLSGQRLWISCSTPQDETITQECTAIAAREAHNSKCSDACIEAMNKCIHDRLSNMHKMPQ